MVGRNTSLTANLTAFNMTSNKSFTNIQQCIPGEPDSKSVIVFKTVILIAILVAALVGNISIIIIVLKTKSLKKAVNFLIANMALADCLLALFSVPKQIVRIVTGSNQWWLSGDAGLALCKIVFIIIDAALVASVASMMCLAIDRFCAVVKTLNRNLITSNVRKGAIIMTWVVALAYTSPYLYNVKMTTYQGESFCQTDWSAAGIDHSKAMTIQAAVSLSILGALPWLLVIVLYALMVNAIKKSKKASKPNLNTRRSKNDLKVTKLSVAIVVCFACCNFPVSAMYLVVAFVWKWSGEQCLPAYWQSLWFAAQVMILLYTVFNPCICFIFSENFRKGFSELFCLGKSLESSRVSEANRSTLSKTTFTETHPSSYVDETTALQSSV